MIADPFGLGELLYGFDFAGGRPGQLAAISAAGYLTLIPDTHDDCSISTFCKNPLHPGPCKGWKKNLGIQAPGALNAIEKARKEKVAAKRVARNEAKSAASKKLTGRQLVSPLHAKKATIKHANTLLGDDDAKAAKKADRVILNKAEIKKYSKIKAAQLNALRSKHGLEEDPGLEDRLADALAKDNGIGKDTLYRETIAVSADSMGAQLAQKHCAKGDGDCDGKPYEWLRDEAIDYAEQAMLTGDDSDLDTFLKDYDAGKAKPPAAPKAKPEPAPKPTTPTAPAADAPDAPDKVLAKKITIKEAGLQPGDKVWLHSKNGKGGIDFQSAKEKQAPGDKPILVTVGDSGGIKKQGSNAVYKNPALYDEDGEFINGGSPASKYWLSPVDGGSFEGGTEAPGLKGNAALAEKGKDFALGLMSKLQGKTSMGTKAYQKAFADKIQAELDGDEAKQGMSLEGAKNVADAVVSHATKASMYKPSLNLGSPATKNAYKTLLAEELEPKIKGGDEPTPLLDAFQKAISAKDAADVKAAADELDTVFQDLAAKKLGVDPTLSGGGKAISALFKPGSTYSESDAKKYEMMAAMADDDFVKLDAPTRQAIRDWLDAKAQQQAADDPNGAELAATQALQAKFGVPVHPGGGPAPKTQADWAADAEKLFDGSWDDPNKTNAQLDVLHNIDPDEFDSLPIGTQIRANKFLVAQQAKYKPGSDTHGELHSLMTKLGFEPEDNVKTAMGTPVAKMWTPQEEYLNHAKAVAAGKYEANPVQAVNLANLITKEQFDNEMTVGEQSDLLLQLKKAHDVGSQPVKDNAKVVHKKLTGNDMPGTGPDMPTVDVEPDVLQQLLDGVPEPGGAGPAFTPAANLPGLGKLPTPKEAFGPDGDVFHDTAVAVVKAMTQADWDAMTPDERSNAMINIDDAKLNGEPGAAEAAQKLSKFLTTALAKDLHKASASALGKEAQLASDYATGAKAGTMTKKFEAYQVLEGDDFAKLPSATQKLIMADLAAAKDKFLAPNKKIAVQETIDHLSPFAGGGAGAGGALGAPNPAVKTNAQKASDGAVFGANLGKLLGNPGDVGQVTDAMEKVLAQVHSVGTADKIAGELAEGYAKQAMNKLSWMHEDPLGNPMLDPSAVAVLQPILAADIAKKLAGKDDPTPVYNAWEKAIHSGTEDDAQAFADAATGYTAGDASAAPKAATTKQKDNLGVALETAWQDAGLGETPAFAPGSLTVQTAVDSALADGVGSPKHLDWAKKTGMVLGINAVNSMFSKVGLPSPEIAKMPTDLVQQVNVQLNKEFEQVLKSGIVLPTDGTLTGDIKDIVAKVNADGDAFAFSLGLAVDNDTIVSYKRELLEARLQNAIAKYPSGAGGAPAVPSIPTPMAPPPPAPAAPAVPAATGAKVKIGTGATSTFTPTQNQIITGTIKAHNVNLSSPAQDDWDVLVATAKAQAGKDGLPKTLTVMDVLNAADAGHAKNLGVSNAGLLRKKILDWLGTASGKAYANANASPKANLLTQMTGDLTVKLKPGQKVQKVGGPGKYVAGYVPNQGTPLEGTWHKQTTSEAIADQNAYWAANPGTTWTAEQRNSFAGYTLGSATINDYLRGVDGEGNPVTSASTATKQSIINMQQGMVPLAKDTLLARGTGWEMFPEAYRSLDGVKKLIGKNVTDKAFLSTSVTGAGSQGFGSYKPVKLTIEAPAGTPGAMLEELSHFSGGDEQEMLLAAGTVLRILSVEPDGSGVRVRARVVTPK